MKRWKGQVKIKTGVFTFFGDCIADLKKNKIWQYTFISLFIKTILLLGLATGGSITNIALLGVFISLWTVVVYLCFLLCILCFAFVFKNRAQLWFLFFVNLLISVLFIFDLWNFRAFGEFISLHLINQSANLNNLSDSIISMIRPVDCVFFLDIAVFIYWIIKQKKRYLEIPRNLFLFVTFLVISTVSIQLIHYQLDIKEKGKKHHLFRICWSPNQTISNLSPLGYHIYDSYLYWKDNEHIILNKHDREKIKDWFINKKENLPDNNFKGMYEGKNLIAIQVESLEGFVIGRKINNQEITPYLNKLLRNSLYFTNIYEQVHNGTSSDADLMTNTSVYPVRRGSTFFRFPNNTYKSLPKLLQSKGYSTTAIHPDKGAYWNWMKALSSIGFMKCIDAASFKADDLIGLGLSDASFFRQVEPVIKEEKRPFYTFMITLTNHSPYNLPKKLRELKIDKNLDKTKLGGYFQSIHYTDKQIGLFLEKLKEDGILQNSVVVIYGDHEGIHKFYPSEVTAVKPSEDWWQKNNRKIPLIIYNNSQEEKVIDTIGGQIDILPTVSYLMGIDPKTIENSAMGRNLLNTRKSCVVLDTMEFIGNKNSQVYKEAFINGITVADKIISGNYFSNKFPH